MISTIRQLVECSDYRLRCSPIELSPATSNQTLPGKGTLPSGGLFVVMEVKFSAGVPPVKLKLSGSPKLAKLVMGDGPLELKFKLRF
jgi:hypothetical protein